MADHVRIGVLGAASIAPAAVIKPARTSSSAAVVAVLAAGKPVSSPRPPRRAGWW